MTTRLNHCPLWMPALLVFCCSGFSQADFISHYTFDNELTDFNPDAQYADSGPAGLDGIFFGDQSSTYTTNSKVGLGALILDGTKSVVIPAASPVFDASFGTNGFTIAAWVNFDASSTGISRIFSAQSTDKGFGVGFDHDGDELYLLASTYGVQDYRQLVNLTAGEYNHIAYRFGIGVGTVEFFVNGLSVGQVNGTNIGIDLPAGDLFAIGGNSLDENFIGLIDDLRIYNQPISNASIEALAGIAIPEPSSVALLAVGMGIGLLRRRRRS